MSYLKTHGFQALTLAEYESIATGTVRPPTKAVMVTFDDGYADTLLIALPLAQRHSIPINIFLCTGLIEGIADPINLNADEAGLSHRSRHPELWQSLKWGDLKRMSSATCGFGFHSHAHRDYGELSEAEIQADIDTGMGLFAKNLGIVLHGFAFPFGTELSCPPKTARLLRGRGFRVAFSTRQAVSQIPSSDFVQPRLLIYEQDDLNTFALKLEGAYDWLSHARTLYQRWRMRAARPACTIEPSERLVQHRHQTEN